MSYAKFQSLNAPPWLQFPNGKAFLTGLGSVKDSVIDYTKQAVKARFPTLAPSDALGAIGDERGLSQGPGESDEDYALRLQNAWNAWVFAGTAVGLLNSLNIAGYTTCVIVQQNGLGFQLTDPPDADITQSLVITNLGTDALIAGTPSWWTFDVNNALTNRFALLFPTVPASWTNVVNPPTSSTAPTINEVNAIRTLIADWKPSKASCMGIVAVTSGEVLGWPVQTLVGSGGNLGTSTVVTFTP